MKRRHISTRERLDIFTRHDGRCWLCGEKLQVGDLWDVEHELALELGGSDEKGSDNLKPAHRACHRIKTTVDAWTIAKSNRVRARHLGASAPSRSPLPGGRRSPWKKKINGSVERRDG